MLLMRILGQGRVCELLDSSDQSLAIDTFFRRMNWRDGVDAAAASEDFTPAARGMCEAYVAGVNAVLARRTPWEFRLFSYRPEPWSIGDSILLARMTGYLTLAQSQAEIERLLLEMVQANVGRELLEELFPGLLSELDDELIRRVKLGERIVPAEVKWAIGLPRMMASNNWAVAGSKSASGKPMLASDPHLETNRLPNVWQEVVLENTASRRYVMGATMPGLPAVIIGRTNDLAWGATYSFMDAVDSWIEQCRDGCAFEEPNTWTPFVARKEIIRRRRNPPVTVTFYENKHGVLDGDPHVAGFYLATNWSAARCGPRSMVRLLELWHARTVEEAREHLGQVETAWNWVLADRAGHIGYQMSGLMPKRRAGVSGLVPLPGWKPENDWHGFVDPHNLPRALDPHQGFFVTANNDLNAYGRAGVAPINMPMGSYRANRIAAVLASSSTLTPRDMQSLQYDLYSLQAEQFMKILRPLLPDTEQGGVLRDWDCRYDVDSAGAHLFEAFYHKLLRYVFGTGGLGHAVTGHLDNHTGTFADFYANFDRILLAERSAWFGEKTREQLFAIALDGVMQNRPTPWGDVNSIELTNILFQGRLPRWLGFDRGPRKISGGRATVHQAQIYRSANRTTSFIPSFHLVTDLAADAIETNLAGGPSDRRFSRWYDSATADWLAGRYKTITPIAGKTS